MTDVQLIDDGGSGSLIGFQPVSKAAKQWLKDHVQSSNWQWLGGTLWVEHRLAETLATAMVADGLELHHG